MRTWVTDRVRSGIIGTGFIGTVHARAVLASGGTVAAVTDGGPAGSRDAAARLFAERAVTSAEEITDADDIDLVHVCTPNYLHLEFALRALAAGKHVICEKPLATTVQGAEQLVRAAANAGAIAVVPFVYRFYAMVREARDRVRDGELGLLHLMHGSYLQDWMSWPATTWRTDVELGGPSRAFADIGIHWCDLAEFVTGDRISRLSARTRIVGPHQASAQGAANEDVATIMFETTGGALGSLVVSQVAHGRKNRLWFSLDGDKAAISFNQEAPDQLWVGNQVSSTLIPRGSPTKSADARRLSTLPSGHPQGYQDCFNALMSDTYAAIAGQASDGLPTFSDGLRAAILTSAVLEASASGEWVEVS
jgi:predicted dehydrogenase